MIGSFFASVAYLWYIYYLVGYAICLRRMYQLEKEAGVEVKAAEAAAGKEQAARSLALPRAEAVLR
jgi:hypothetical protein